MVRIRAFQSGEPRQTYPLLADSLGLAWTSLDAGCGWRTVGGDIELWSPDGVLEIKGIELLADAVEHHSSLEALLIAGLRVLRSPAPLLLRLLGSCDPLLPERRLEALQLRPCHGDEACAQRL